MTFCKTETLSAKLILVNRFSCERELKERKICSAGGGGGGG